MLDIRRIFTSPGILTVDFQELAAAAAAGDQRRFRDSLNRQSEAIRLYLRAFRVDGAPPELAANYVDDAYQRFLHTLGLLPLTPVSKVLEIGSNPYYFHVLLHKIFPQATIEGVNFFDKDIFSTHQGETLQTTRNSVTGESFEFGSKLFNLETLARYPYPEASFDLVFFCETLEHLVVNPLPTFRKLKRLLKPGGHLVITLPNAVRLANFALMLHGHNFFDTYQTQNGVHGRHNREYTLPEMKALLAADGFDVVRAETHDRYDYERGTISTMDYTGRTLPVPQKRAELLKILKKSGGSTDDRGDNLYLLARKPAAWLEHPLRQAPADCPPDGPIAPHTTLLSDPEQLLVSLDLCDDDGSRLTVEGWAARREGEAAHQSTSVVLQSEAISYAFRAERVRREDAADAMCLPFDDPGFRVTVDKRALLPGEYALGVWLHAASLLPVFTLLGRSVTIDG